MKTSQNLTPTAWDDYALLDSGDGMKLERFGNVTVARPETQALWKKAKPALWKDADATFDFSIPKGAWKIKTKLPDSWKMTWDSLTFRARLSPFKHVGIFPEQEPNWKWIDEKVRNLEKTELRTSDVRSSARVLNLFGYTGVATLVAAKAGAIVTHVDASKQSLDFANENAKLSTLDNQAIRFVHDDAFGFAKREARRGEKYDGIILDPPAFGRGGKGEVWKIEEDLPKLLDTLRTLLSDKPGSFFLLNGYAASYAPLSFAQAVESVFGNVSREFGELLLKEKASDRAIAAGIYVRFVRE